MRYVLILRPQNKLIATQFDIHRVAQKNVLNFATKIVTTNTNFRSGELGDHRSLVIKSRQLHRFSALSTPAISPVRHFPALQIQVTRRSLYCTSRVSAATALISFTTLHVCDNVYTAIVLHTETTLRLNGIDSISGRPRLRFALRLDIQL